MIKTAFIVYNGNMTPNMPPKQFIANSHNIGNQIEIFCGGIISPSSSADIGNYEIKSQNVLAKSAITLGGKIGSISDIVNQVMKKIDTVIFFEYSISELENGDKIVTIENCTIFSDIIEKREFFSLINENDIIVDKRDKIRTLRIYKKNLYKIWKKSENIKIL